MKLLLLCFLSCLFPVLLVNGVNPHELAAGNNKFAFKLYNELKSNEDKNLFYSPFSISTALAMVYAGARNETALQISQTLNFAPNANFHSDYKNLLGNLKKETDGGIKLNIANGLWVQKDFNFLDSYFEIVRSNYSSELKNVDFIDESEREITRKDINDWVAQKTNDKIKDILSPGVLTRLTRLVLVNAIYFYGDWAKPFKKEDTEPKDFFLTDQSRVEVPFMNQHGMYNYFEDSNIKAIEIPYKDNRASMVIFLPNEKNGIPEFDKSFDYKYYQNIVSAFQYSEVRLSLPKFTTTNEFNLSETLSKMGMPLAFSPGGADFSGMDGKLDLYISTVIHQAFINVDEKGTEAAAATAVVIGATAVRPSSDIKVFNVDHPFIFYIKDNSTGSILFMGKMMNPGLGLH
jgi:serpin B